MLPRERILEFQKIFEEKYNKKFSVTEAEEAANNLVGFFEVLLQADIEEIEQSNDTTKSDDTKFTTVDCF